MDERYNKLIKTIQCDERETKLYMPNEIFNDLRVLHDKGSSHVAFAYSYYYLISWLYRYTKYGLANIDVKMIKELLGYSGDNKKVNYLIKKNGVLDEMGYTRTDTDYPIVWEFNGGDIIFSMFSELELIDRKMYQSQRGKNYKVKIPLKGLWRTNESELNNYFDGTYYDISYTHELNFNLFLECMMNKGLGVNGFYLYGYLKYRCDQNGSYNSSIEKIGSELGMSKNTTEKYLSNLWLAGLIKQEENECVKIDGEFRRKANTYYIVGN